MRIPNSLALRAGRDKTVGMRSAPLILASRSPARAALLCGAGYTFEQVVADCPEPPPAPGESLTRYVRRLARLKAETVAERFPAAWVLGADTALILEGRIIGKPADLRSATAMLMALAGRTHRICSAACLAGPCDRNGRRAFHTTVDTAWVTLRDWPAPRIRAHVALTTPVHWAGAYAVQDPVSCAIVARIRGDLATVIGLPMTKLHRGASSLFQV